MELKECIETRASVRVFSDQTVTVDQLKELVRRAGMAPSVNNAQPWKFIAITASELLKKMAAAVSESITGLPANQSKRSGMVKNQVEWFATFFEDAPALIALVMEDYETILEKGVDISHEEINKMRNFPNLQSAGGAIQNILLSAVDLGLGACWMSAPLMARKELEKILKLDPNWQLISFVAVGYPKTKPIPANRKSLEEIFELLD